MIPGVFARKPGPITDFEHWKGIEFRLFLLYIGQLLLKDVLPDQIYAHFMLLCVGCGILTNESIASLEGLLAFEQKLRSNEELAQLVSRPTYTAETICSVSHKHFGSKKAQ